MLDLNQGSDVYLILIITLDIPSFLLQQHTQGEVRYNERIT